MSSEGNGSGSSSYRSPKMRKLTRSDLERLLEEMKQLCYSDEKNYKPKHQTECPTVWARDLGIVVNHITSNNIEVQVKCGIAYSHFDGCGRHKRIIFVNLNLRYADIRKEIESRCDLAPGTYQLQFQHLEYWSRLAHDMDWRACLGSQLGKEYIIVRCLMERPTTGFAHLKPEDIQLRVEYGIAYSDDDGDGNDKGVVYVQRTAEVAHVRKVIEAQTNLAPGTFILQYYYDGCWKMLSDGMDWNFYLSLGAGNQYINVRCLMEGPGTFTEDQDKQSSFANQ